MSNLGVGERLPTEAAEANYVLKQPLMSLETHDAAKARGGVAESPALLGRLLRPPLHGHLSCPLASVRSMSVPSPCMHG